MPEAETFGQRLERLLEKRNKEKSQLAEYLGVSPSNVTRWIAGEFKPKIKKRQKIAEFLGITVEELMYGIKDESTLRGEEQPEPSAAVDADLISYATARILAICDEQGFKPTHRQLGRLVGLVYKTIAGVGDHEGNGEADEKIREMIDFAMDGNRKENNNNRKTTGPETNQERSEHQKPMKPISG